MELIGRKNSWCRRSLQVRTWHLFACVTALQWAQGVFGSLHAAAHAGAGAFQSPDALQCEIDDGCFGMNGFNMSPFWGITGRFR